MYSYIIGKITNISPKYVTLECQNIGYLLIVPNPYSFQLDTEYKIHVYQHIRQDCNDLFGFQSSEEREMFLRLINVTGIGPKSALSILASGSVSAVNKAIESGDDVFLRKFPGIGPKASKQIILDLKGKLNLDDNSISDNKSKISDVEEALVALGYSRKEVNKVLSKLDNTLDESTLIKTALRKMI